ncbi:MAG: metallophosphoesterase family protein [Thermodesulfobacteriota bacterium]
MSARRIFAVGDIHGCLDKLEGLMGILPVNLGQDTIVFLGDYINRGPASPQVIDYLLDLQTKVNYAVFLMGNHEKMFLDYLSMVDPFLFILNGGQKTIDAYSRGGEFFLPPAHHDFFHSLRLIYETEDYIFVHAGLRPNVPLKDQKIDDILWIREAFFSSMYDFGKEVVFGHTPFSEPLVMRNKIGIDTGAVYGNKLTCVELPAQKFYSF